MLQILGIFLGGVFVLIALFLFLAILSDFLNSKVIIPLGRLLIFAVSISACSAASWYFWEYFAH